MDSRYVIKLQLFSKGKIRYMLPLMGESVQLNRQQSKRSGASKPPPVPRSGGYRTQLKLSNQSLQVWWARRESNPQSVRNTILSRARIPVPPLALKRMLQGVIVLYLGVQSQIELFVLTWPQMHQTQLKAKMKPPD